MMDPIPVKQIFTPGKRVCTGIGTGFIVKGDYCEPHDVLEICVRLDSGATYWTNILDVKVIED